MEMTEYRKIAWIFSQNHCFSRFLYRFQRDPYQNNASIGLLLSLLPTQNNEPSNATPFDLESYQSELVIAMLFLTTGDVLKVRQQLTAQFSSQSN